jgi:hypothetical protein
MKTAKATPSPATATKLPTCSRAEGAALVVARTGAEVVVRDALAIGAVLPVGLAVVALVGIAGSVGAPVALEEDCVSDQFTAID